MPPDPQELLRRADAAAGAGATQDDLRGAISDAYYAIFHAFATAAADMVCGSAARSSKGYSLVYRSIDHKTLRSLCAQLGQTKPQNVAVMPSMGLGNISNLAGLVVSLQGERHLASYEPLEIFTNVRAKGAIAGARLVLALFSMCHEEQQKTFLIMLLFRQRDKA